MNCCHIRSKCFWKVFSDPDITLNGEQLSVCSSFKYIGNMITNDAHLNVEIKTRIGQATAPFSKLFHSNWKQKTAPTKLQSSQYLYKTVKPGTAKQIHFKKLEGCQYRFLRTIIGKKWEDFISYLSIFEILETKKKSITAIEPLVRMKRLQCLCKILKMDNSRLLRKVAFSETIEGKRKKGRPLLSWRQAISQDIKAFHLEHIYTLSKCDQIKQLS